MNRADRRRQAKEARRAGSMMAGPYRAPPGMANEGMTNEDALAAMAEALGGPPERGALYRVILAQGDEGNRSRFIGEYVGLGVESFDGRTEYATRWIVRNPVLPANAANGTAENPWTIWPLDILGIAPAEAGDLDTPMHYRSEGDPEPRTPGKVPRQ